VRRRLAVVSLAACVGAALVLGGCTPVDARSPTADGDATVLTGSLTVFAAASLTDVFGELEAQFEQRHPDLDVVLVVGGSSALAQQLIAGAPADVYAAADEVTMQTAVDAGVVDAPTVFARGALALAVPRGNPGAVTSLDDLSRPDLLVALCASEVPCGRAADALLAARGITPSVDTREQDVRSVLTKITLGEVDAGLVYAPDVQVAGGAVQMIPIADADADADADAAADADGFGAVYALAAVRGSANPSAVEAWGRLILGPAGRSALASAGFTVVDS
jgi:molybdate transport system substrate-binding protein